MNSFAVDVSGDIAKSYTAALATQPAPASAKGPIAWVLAAVRWWWTAVVTPTDDEEKEFLSEI